MTTTYHKTLGAAQNLLHTDTSGRLALVDLADDHAVSVYGIKDTAEVKWAVGYRFAVCDDLGGGE